MNPAVRRYRRALQRRAALALAPLARRVASRAPRPAAAVLETAASAHFRAGRLSDALDFARAAREAAPSVNALETEARALVALARSDEAAALLRPLFDSPASARPTARLVDVYSRALAKAGHETESVEIVRRWVQPERLDYRLSRAYARVGRFREALEHADRAVAHGPGDPWALNARANALRGLGDLAGALEAVKRARALLQDRRLEAAQDRLEGLITTLSGEWLPSIPGSPPRLDPRPGVVLHLLDRSFPHTLSGYAVRSMYIVRSQRQIGLEPVVATRLGVPRVGGVASFPLREEIEGVVHHRLVAPGVEDYDALRKDRYLTLYAAEAARLVEQVRPSVIHAAASHLNGLVGLVLKQRYGIPLVYEVRNFYEDLWVSHREGGEDTEFYAGRVRAETQCMLGADRVVTLGEGMRRQIVERGIDPDRVVVVGNAVDTDRFSPRPRNDALLASLGLGGRTILGYVSGLRRYEGIDVLLRAIRVLLDRGHRVGGLVVGDGVEMETLRSLVRDVGLEQDVRLTGEVPHDHVLDYYAAIDVFVVPRRSDPVGHLVTPLKPFEAMAMGLPLIVSDVGALHEVAAPEERGLGFTPDDPLSLAEQIERLLNDPSLGRATAERARSWVLRERTWIANARRYRALYEEMIAEQDHEPRRAGI